MKIQESVINFAKAAAEKAYYGYIADQFIPESGVAREILINIIWACAKHYEKDFYACGDDKGYDYYIEVSGTTCRIREQKLSVGYVNNIEIGCNTIENAVNALKYLFD